MPIRPAFECSARGRMPRTMRRVLPCLAALLALAIFAGPASAEEWELHLVGQWLTTSADFGELDDGLGASVALERRLNDRWGVEFGLGWNQLEGSISQSFDFLGFRGRSRIETEVEWLPVSVGGNFHLTPGSEHDVYLGARVGYAFFRDIRVDTEIEITDTGGLPFPIVLPPLASSIEFPTDDAFFYGLRLGYDRAFGTGGWGFSATIDWTVLEVEFRPTGVGDEFPPGPDFSNDLDPLAIGAGVIKRW